MTFHGNKHSKPETCGHGWRDERRPHFKRHVLRLDEETFDEVRRIAVEKGHTLSEQFRIFIEWGLEAHE